jgi:SEC-C motif domain protein
MVLSSVPLMATAGTDNGGMNYSAVPAPDPSMRCPCLSGESYGNCCGRFHSGEAAAPSAEYLMRSRYSAFAVGNTAYLLATWHSRTRPAAIELDPEQRWTRLDILGVSRGGMLDVEGTVEFRAFFRYKGSVHEQHEVSRFAREDGRWVYLDAR